jgi:hypothetical protein
MMNSHWPRERGKDGGMLGDNASGSRSAYAQAQQLVETWLFRKSAWREV